MRLNGRGVAGLASGAGAEEVRVWTDAAVERLQQMEHTCSLDVADEGRHLMRTVARLHSVRRQRMVQEIEGAKEAMLEGVKAAGVGP